MSCGDFDGRALKREAQAKKIWIPNYLKRWINIKKAFPMHLIDEGKRVPDFTDPNTIYNIGPKVRGMPEMLKLCGLKLEGRHHSGIDDSKNIARVALSLMTNQNFEFTQGMVVEEPYEQE